MLVTVDPQRETLGQLKLELSSFDPSIRGFTGTDAQLAASPTLPYYLLAGDDEQDDYTLDGLAGVLLLDKRDILGSES